MLEVLFACNDETMRAALRWGLNWEHLGFTCAGEAADGELALTMMRRQPPDLLLTALSLPYLNGLELCRRVRQEFPRTRILIVSHSRDVKDLQKAVEIGVDGYLFHDFQPEELRESVLRVRARLEEQSRQDAELRRLRERSEAYRSNQRDRFFLNLVSQDTSVSSLYDQAQELGIELAAEEYSVLLCLFRAYEMDSAKRRELFHILDNLQVLFDKTSQLDCFSYYHYVIAVLVRSDAGRMESQVSFCIRNIRRSLLPLGDECQWVVACSGAVTRVSALPGCFAQAQEVLAYSALQQGQQVLTPESVNAMHSESLEAQLSKLSTPILLSEELNLYLSSGTPEDARAFACYCVDRMGQEAIQVPELGRYIMLRIRLATMSYVHNILHLEVEQLVSALDNLPPMERIFGREGVLRYLTALLTRATQLRDSARWSGYHPSVRESLRFIDHSFTEPGLTLAHAAQAAGLSPNYFSTLFRKEVGCTFGEYLTEKRIGRARELLRSTALRTAQVAQAVGYQDAHYFSNLFRRTQGCTPREYRSRAAEEQRRAAAGNQPAGRRAAAGNRPAGLSRSDREK